MAFIDEHIQFYMKLYQVKLKKKEYFIFSNRINLIPLYIFINKHKE